MKSIVALLFLASAVFCATLPETQPEAKTNIVTRSAIPDPAFLLQTKLSTPLLSMRQYGYRYGSFGSPFYTPYHFSYPYNTYNAYGYLPSYYYGLGSSYLFK